MNVEHINLSGVDTQHAVLLHKEGVFWSSCWDGVWLSLQIASLSKRLRKLQDYFTIGSIPQGPGCLEIHPSYHSPILFAFPW